MRHFHFMVQGVDGQGKGFSFTGEVEANFPDVIDQMMRIVMPDLVGHPDLSCPFQFKRVMITQIDASEQAIRDNEALQRRVGKLPRMN